MIRVVFSDTNALISMLCFPGSLEAPSMSSELLQAIGEQTLELLVTDTVEHELRKVVARDFAAFGTQLDEFLQPHFRVTLPNPSPELLARARDACTDPNDVIIATSAVQSAETHGVFYLLSNDFQNFHTPTMKTFLLEHGLEPISLYGLLKLLGRRP